MMKVESLIPHSKPMVLLDGVLEVDEWSLTAVTKITERSPFFRPAGHALSSEIGGVPSWVGVEYMAQAVAAWSGAQAKDAEPEFGFLVGVREYSTSHPVFPLGSQLKIRVQVQNRHGNLAVFDCQIESPQITAKAVLSVYIGEPPEHNKE